MNLHGPEQMSPREARHEINRHDLNNCGKWSGDEMREYWEDLFDGLAEFDSDYAWCAVQQNALASEIANSGKSEQQYIAEIFEVANSA